MRPTTAERLEHLAKVVDELRRTGQEVTTRAIADAMGITTARVRQLMVLAPEVFPPHEPLPDARGGYRGGARVLQLVPRSSTCFACGALDVGGEHACPRTDRERIDALEQRVWVLERMIVSLGKGLERLERGEEKEQA